VSRGEAAEQHPAEERERKEREGRAHNQTTPIQKPQKEEKRREKTTQSFVQTKQEQEPTSTHFLLSSLSLSLSLSPPVRPLAHQIQFFPRPPSRIRRNSFASRARLLRVRGICSLFPLESCLGRRLEGGASEGEGRFCWASRGHGRCGARYAIRPPYTQGRQAQSASAQR